METSYNLLVFFFLSFFSYFVFFFPNGKADWAGQNQILESV